MKVSGFSFIRNAVRYDYPVVESITSVLPLCDEFIVMVGNSDDNTTNIIERIGSEKIKIYDSTWDETLRKDGKVLAVETNKAFDKISADSDWAFYIQADEVLHERFQKNVHDAMTEHLNNEKVEGLLFKYKHFYGSYNYVGDSTRWYRNEVRIIRNDKSIRSFRDAQGFQKNNRPLNVKPVDAEIYHYGWVKPPESQQSKQKYFHSLWHDENWVKQHVGDSNQFDYSKIDSLTKFTNSHPEVMQKRIANVRWDFVYDPKRKKLSLKSRFKLFFERMTGYRIGEYKNFRQI